MDITEYLDNELKETCEIIYDWIFLKPTTVEGKTYGILRWDLMMCRRFYYREDIVEELDIDMSAVTKPEDLTAVFEKVKRHTQIWLLLILIEQMHYLKLIWGRITGFDPLGDNIANTVAGVAYQDDSIC